MFVLLWSGPSFYDSQIVKLSLQLDITDENAAFSKHDLYQVLPKNFVCGIQFKTYLLSLFEIREADQIKKKLLKLCCK